MKLSPLFALLIVATTSAAFAQTPPANDPNQSTPTTDSTRDPNMAPAQVPPSGTQTAQAAGQTPTQAAQKDPHNIQSSGPEDWTMVNGHDKGYLTKQDAMPNSWLAQNFSSCDKDSDGKITQAEYDSCVKRR